MVNKNKNITIETLAVMVQNGFEGVDKRFDGMDERFEEVHEHLRIVDGRFDAIEMELIDIKKKLDNIVYRHEYEALKERITLLEKKVGKQKSI